MSTSSGWSSTPFSKATLCQGDGLVIDGKIEATRMHSVFVSGDATKNIGSMEENLPTRFVVCECTLLRAFKRVTLDSGLELDYKRNETRGASHKNYVALSALDADALARAVGDAASGVALPRGFFLDGEAGVHPAVPQRFDLFVNAAAHGAKALVAEQEVRFLTHGASVFVERFENLSGTANVFGKNASGETEQLSDQWTKGIEAAAAKKAPEEELEGVDSEEWSD